VLQHRDVVPEVYRRAAAWPTAHDEPIESIRYSGASCRSGACGSVPGAAMVPSSSAQSLTGASIGQPDPDECREEKKMMPPTIKNPAHEKGVPTRKLTITPPTSGSRPNRMHNQAASRRGDVGLGVDPAPVEAVTGNHPARDGHGLVSSSLFFQRRAPMAAGAFYSIRMNRSPWPGFKLPAVAPFKQVVQDAGQIMRGRAGAGQISGSAADGPAGIGVVVGPDPAGVVVVGPDPAGVVVDVQPTIKLAKQLRQPAGQHGQLGDQPVKLGRPGSLRHRGVAEVQADGAAFALADHLGLDTLAASTGYVAGWASAAAAIHRLPGHGRRGPHRRRHPPRRPHHYRRPRRCSPTTARARQLTDPVTPVTGLRSRRPDPGRRGG